MADITNSNLHNIDTGILKKDACVVLVKTEWNAAITDQLERGCVAKLEEIGVRKTIIVTVPGAVEIPFTIRHFWEQSAKKDKPDAFIALGCVIKGDTPHFEYVCQSVTEGIGRLNLLLPVPVIFGVLTVNTEEQAIERIGGKHGHKGEEAAITALKMITLAKNFKKH
ncbi:MAG: 6,7-dimethyl-8-ribityllumazine synthase [Chitinophagaceae bacterium]|nr:6,7-dimethyl-8-ribityllumazine synthase [Chitinophagaceae bacterium]MBK8952890.1 6,7-dimethyl-8-ribityllumazine synthase [Chitinophagaceae bacterium]